jgi:hypothetical protein
MLSLGRKGGKIVKEAIGTASLYGAPVSKNLVELIERSADELTHQYLEDVKQHSHLPTYRAFDEKELYKRAYRVYSQLGKWISQETTKEEIKSYWTDLGKQRREEGFPLPEIILSLSMLRRHLWIKVQAEGLLDSALDLYQAMELHNRVITFFDRAVYYAACGYDDKD